MTQGHLPLVVREVDPQLRPDPDGLLHPIPSSSINEVVLEERDGADIIFIASKGLSVRVGTENNLRRTASIDDAALRVAITDARVAVACSGFDKGGGWVGGIAVTLVANTLSKGLAAARRHGKMLVAHARYPWLYAVGASPKSGLLDEEVVRLCMHTESGEALVFDLTLPSDLSASAVAAEIAGRAASFRLMCNQAPEHQAEFEALRVTQGVVSENGGYRFHIIPGSQPIGEPSARVAPIAR